MMGRPPAKTERVPWLREENIEAEAETLFALWQKAHGEVSEPPVPVDEMIELQLNLRYEIDDLQKRFGHGDVLGAIWFKEQLIRVDRSLDPVEHPRMLGRYRFTLAHEIGHWQLHRKVFLRDETQVRSSQAPHQGPRGCGVKLIFEVVVDVSRTDGKKPGRVAQSLSEQLFEVLDERCKDETFLVAGSDHALTVDRFALISAGRESKKKVLAKVHQACHRCGRITSSTKETICRPCGAHLQLVRACESAQCACSPAERESGHLVGCWMPEMLDALARSKGGAF